MRASRVPFVPVSTPRWRWTKALVGGSGGFTLVELLTVVAVIAVLLALIVPATLGFSRSNGLGSAGRLFANLLTVARSEAINRRTVVRVEIATDWPRDPGLRYRKATLTAATFHAARGRHVYGQIAGWETLPDGVCFETDNVLATDPAYGPGGLTDGSLYLTDPRYAANHGTTRTTTGSFFAGQPIPTVYVAFQPDGALFASAAGAPMPAVRVRLTEGSLLAGSSDPIRVAYTHGNQNWFGVRVNALTGRVECERPESPLP